MGFQLRRKHHPQVIVKGDEPLIERRIVETRQAQSVAYVQPFRNVGSPWEDGEVRFVKEEVVGFLGLTAFDRLAPNDDAAVGEEGFFADLGHHVPFVAIRANQRGRDELGADVRLGESFLVHAVGGEVASAVGLPEASVLWFCWAADIEYAV